MTWAPWAMVAVLWILGAMSNWNTFLATSASVPEMKRLLCKRFVRFWNFMLWPFGVIYVFWR